MNRLVSVGKPIGDAGFEPVDSLSGESRQLHRGGKPVREAPPSQCVDRIDLVDDDLEREVGCADLVQHGVDRRSLFIELIVGRRRVDDVEDEIGHQGFLEGRGESLHELGRETPDEADGVCHEVAATLVHERSGGRIERLEQAVVHGHVCIGQGIQQRRLAHVRVAGERHGRRLRPAAFLPSDLALLAQITQTTPQERDAAACDPAVALELRLTGTPSPDSGSERARTASQTLEVLPHAPHPRQVVFELGELDLKLPLGADRVLGEDVQDQLGAIDDTRLERVLECALLRRLKLVVDEEHLGTGLPVGPLQLFELPLTEIGPLLRARAMLDDFSDRLDERGPRQLAELAEFRIRIHPRCQHGDDEPALERGVRLPLDHDRIMPPTGQNPTMRLSPALAATGTYPFVRLEQAKRELVAKGVELIDFGKGDPREPTDRRIRQALAESITEISTYPLAEGLPELRAAVARWCGRRFGVDLDPDTELIPTYGSKEAIFLLAQLVVDRQSEKRVVVTTEPGYPVPDRGAVFAGADVVQLPLLEHNAFLPDLDAVEPALWENAAIVWINYPNNPTGAVAPLDFLGRLADLSREHGFLLASDEAYTELWFEGPPHSALEVRGRGNVAVFNTLSKRSSMTGYRSGFIAAGAELIAALKQFRPSVGTAPQEFVQRASIVAWDDEDHVEHTRDAYRRKREALLPTLARKGVRLAGGAATMFLWLEVPGSESAEEFAARLLQHGLIVSPGTFFGPAGEGYWRLALVPTEAECRRAAEILEEVL